MSRLALAIGLAALSKAAWGDTVIWSGSTGVWSDAASWTPHAPAATDTVVITNGGTVTLDVSSTVGSVTLGKVADCGGGTLMVNGQTLTYGGQILINPCGQLLFSNGGQLVGLGSATLAGELTWAGGTFPYAGTVTLATNCTLTINSAADHDMPGVVLVNYGTVAWNGGRIRGGGSPGTVIFNHGLWDSQGDLVFNSDYSREGLVFNNLGTFRKSAGTNNTVFNTSGGVPMLVNLGTIDIQTGSLALQGGADLLGGATTGDGEVYLAGGAFNINGMTTTTNVQLVGGGLVGDNVLQGGFTWAAGNWNSASSVTLNPGGELDILSGNDHDLASCTFTNLGTVKWLNGRLRGGGAPGTAIYNLGTWEVRCDQPLNSDFQQQGVQFHNLGTWRKLGTTGGTTFSPNGSEAILDNSGLIDVQSGALVLNSGALLSGGAVTGSGALLLNSGSFTLAGTTTSTNVQFTGGFFSGDNIIVGGLTWVAGNWNGASSVTVTNGSELDIVSTADHDLFSCVLTNFGLVKWVAGRVRGGGNPGTVIYNSGIWDSRDDLVMNSDGQQEGLVFNNLGTFRKSRGANSTVFSPNGSLAFLNNVGRVDIQTGSVSLNSGASLAGGTLTGSGVLNLAAGSFNINGMVLTSNAQLTGGALAGTNVLRGGMTWVGGQWNGADLVTLPAGSVLSIMSANDHDLASCVFRNFGTVVWTAGRIRGGGTPGTDIYNLGTWEARCDSVINSDFGQYGVVFYNQGTLKKLGTAGNTQFNPNNSAAALNNAGTIDIQTGSLVLNGGGSFNSGSVQGAGFVSLNGGGFNLAGTTTTPNVQLTGGVLVQDNVIHGGFTWANGNWNSAESVTVAQNAELDIVSGNDHDLAGCAVTNLGTVRWLGGRLRGGGPVRTVIYNAGSFEAQCDQVINSDFGQFGLAFNNAGRFRKSGTTGATVFSPNNSQCAFYNLGGDVELDGGSLSLPGDFSLSGGRLTIGIGGGTPGLFGVLGVGGRPTLDGTLGVVFTGSYGFTVNDQFAVVTCPSPLLTSQFNTVSLPPGLTVTYTTSAAILKATGSAVKLVMPQVADGQFLFSLLTVFGQSYNVQQSTNLVTGNWTVFTNFVGDGSLVQFAVPIAPIPQRYFRVFGP